MANERNLTSQQPTAADGQPHGNRKPQIKKEDLYMLMALWMEQSPWAMTTTDKERVVGAVFVQPNDRVLSVDCSRSNDGGIVHGAIRALLKYPDQVEGCYVYLSRQPCAHCVKMLVQAAVKKVFYLPLTPEKDEQEENKRSVDALFKVSPVSREVYVPNITKDDLEVLESANKKNPYDTRNLAEDKLELEYAEQWKVEILAKIGWPEKNEHEEENGSVDGTRNLNDKLKSKWSKQWKEELVTKIGWNEYSDTEIKKQDKREEWKNADQIVAKIGWDEYTDQGIRKQVDEDMEFFFTWFDQGILATGEKEMNFKESKTTQGPVVTQKVANHLSRLAQMLSNQTDDPNTGVGCVITIDEEIVAIGWNGFPSKALYGNHPRGSKEDEAIKKYPHIIYALENALLFRNRRELDGCVVYHTIVPSDEGISMLYQLGAKVLVLPSFLQDEELKKEKPLFYDCLQEEKLDVYSHIKGQKLLPNL